MREIESVRPTYSYILALELTGFASGLDDVTRQGIKGHTKVLAWKLTVMGRKGVWGVGLEGVGRDSGVLLWNR